MARFEIFQEIISCAEEKQVREDYLARARAAAMELSIACNHSGVSVDDVRAVCPPPPGISPKIMGAIFAGKIWVRYTPVHGARSISHGRTIWKWVPATHYAELVPF